MPSRIIRDGIIESVAINSLPWEAELFYRRLMSIVDDYGRYSALPQLLVSRCYPLQVDKVSTSDVTKWLTLCSKQELIVLYKCIKDKPWLEIQQFNQRTRTPSKFPAKLGKSVECITDARHLTVECEDEVEDEDDIKPKPKAKKRAHALPDDWKPKASHIKLCEEEGMDVIRAATEFSDWAVGGGKTYVCWDRTFSRAIRNWLKDRPAVRGRGGAVSLDPLGKPIKKWK